MAALRPLAWSQAAWPQAAWSRAQEARVVLLLSGVINDGGWGELAFAGLKKLGTQPDFRTAYAEEISLAQIQQVARGYSDDGFDLILGHGFEFSSVLLDIAPDYTSQHYFVTSFRPRGKVPGNIMFVNMGNTQPGILPSDRSR